MAGLPGPGPTGEGTVDGPLSEDVFPQPENYCRSIQVPCPLSEPQQACQFRLRPLAQLYLCIGSAPALRAIAGP